MSVKQLFIDISELVNQDAKSGIQRVVRSILSELIKNPPSGYAVNAVYANTTEEGYYYAHEFMQEFLNISDNNYRESQGEAISFNQNDIFIGLDLQHHVVLSQKLFYQQLKEKGVKCYFVLYDLLPVLMPHAFHESVEQLHHDWLSVLANQDGVMCISKAVADEFVSWIQEHKIKQPKNFKIKWFHLGADVESSIPTTGFPDDSGSTLEKLATFPSFLMVGTIEPRKGQAQVLLAFDQLWESGKNINLVIVGKQGWEVDGFIEKIQSHPELNKRLFWLNGISDEYLEKVYESSDCLIAASEGEGFGLPLIEAAQKKLPIIARDIPVFREVAEEFAFYFKNEKNSLVIEETIVNWLELYMNSTHPKSDDMPWLTWKESTEELLKCVEN